MQSPGRYLRSGSPSLTTNAIPLPAPIWKYEELLNLFALSHLQICLMSAIGNHVASLHTLVEAADT